MSMGTFTWGVALSYPSPHISRLRYMNDRIFVGIDGMGVVIYQTPGFKTPIGRIPLPGNLTTMYGGGDSTLAVIEREGSLSFYKVKK